MTHELVGKKYIFEDGNSIEVIQVKDTDPDSGGKRVTYLIRNGPGIPQKLVLPIDEFMSYYSQLFK